MKAEFTNLWLFALVLTKVFALCGFGLFGIVIYAGGKLAKLRRVPARNRPVNVVSIERQRLCRTVRRSA